MIDEPGLMNAVVSDFIARVDEAHRLNQSLAPRIEEGNKKDSSTSSSSTSSVEDDNSDDDFESNENGSKRPFHLVPILIVVIVTSVVIGFVIGVWVGRRGFRASSGYDTIPNQP